MQLREYRLKSGKLQKQVAADLGIDRSRYVKWETGKSEPPAEIILRLADYYGVSVDELLGRETAYQAGTMAGLKLDEKRLLREFRKLSVEGKAKVFEFVMMAYHSFPGDREDQE